MNLSPEEKYILFAVILPAIISFFFVFNKKYINRIASGHSLFQKNEGYALKFFFFFLVISFVYYIFVQDVLLDYRGVPVRGRRFFGIKYICVPIFSVFMGLAIKLLILDILIHSKILKVPSRDTPPKSETGSSLIPDPKLDTQSGALNAKDTERQN